MPDLPVTICKGNQLHHYDTPLHALPRTFNIDDMIFKDFFSLCVVCVCVCMCVCFVCLPKHGNYHKDDKHR